MTAFFFVEWQKREVGRSLGSPFDYSTILPISLSLLSRTSLRFLRFAHLNYFSPLSLFYLHMESLFLQARASLSASATIVAKLTKQRTKGGQAGAGGLGKAEGRAEFRELSKMLMRRGEASLSEIKSIPCYVVRLLWSTGFCFSPH